jgi:predicted AAA+ superfamily ATPase
MGEKNRKIYLDILEQKLSQGKEAVIIYGPRRVGKTTLIKQFLEIRKAQGKSVRFLDGDSFFDRQYFDTNNPNLIFDLIKNCDVLAIDEAQSIAKIDLIIKNLVDHSPSKIELIISGSSTIGITDLVEESNVGRTKRILMHPAACFEISDDQDFIQKNLHDRLIFGSYPKIAFEDNDDLQKKDFLTDLVNNYLLKDVFNIDGIKNSVKIEALARILAHRITKEINTNEIASELRLERREVENYLDLMEKSFIIFKLDPYSKNQDNVIKKQKKYFFYDLGIRNALIQDFSVFSLRSADEVGKLWENFIVAERMKRNNCFYPFKFRTYFWKTNKNFGDQEVDFVEEMEDGAANHLYGYEIKYSKDRVVAPSQWTAQFPVANFSVVNKYNFFDFIGRDNNLG